jgi:hypothetical protein
MNVKIDVDFNGMDHAVCGNPATIKVTFSEITHHYVLEVYEMFVHADFAAIVGSWHQSIEITSLESQSVTFAARFQSVGVCVFSVAVYHQRRWLVEVTREVEVRL